LLSHTHGGGAAFVAEIFEEGAADAEAAVERGAAAIAIALDETRGRRRRTDTVDAFLEDQRRLTAAQLTHLHAQFGSLRWRAWADRLKVTLQALTVLVGVIALGAVGAIAWNAARDQDLVIDGFSVPPDLAQQGSTGAAVATELHDKLGQLHEETVTPIQTIAVRQKPTSDARVEIPETGISLSEVNRLLHEWLGHETHVSGELSHVAAGPEKGTLALNIRVGERPGVRLVQPDGDLESLLSKAAEHVYASREPSLYVDWLDQHGRSPEAIALNGRLASSGPTAERVEALWKQAFYQQAELTPAQQRDLLAQATQLDPVHANWNNLAVADWELGRLELAAREMQESITRERHATVGLSAEARKTWGARPISNLAIYKGDYSGGLVASCADFHVAPCEVGALVEATLAGPNDSRFDSFSPQRASAAANLLAYVHDTRDSERLLAAPRADVSRRSEGFRAITEGQWIYAALQTHRQQGDWAAVLRDSDAHDALAARWPGLRSPARVPRWRPVALAHLGDAAGARAAADALPRDCYPCAIAHGMVEDVLGDRAASDRWFAEAIRMGPSLPQAEAAWAEVRLARGDADGALKLAQAAYGKSPRFADASAVWGEALLAQGAAKGATVKFEEAAKLTPRWGRLHLKWGEALARLGRRDEARAQFAAAAALDLTAAERAELAKARA
jgi:tetratricopeptide (TPR) repeat protein